MPDIDKHALEKVRKDIMENPVILYMKGTPDSPCCGFSAVAISILKNIGIRFHSVNVLEDNSVREAVRLYADWPTFPQLYVNGDLVGGCDIMKEMHLSGELKKLFEDCKLINAN